MKAPIALSLGLALAVPATALPTAALPAADPSAYVIDLLAAPTLEEAETGFTLLTEPMETNEFVVAGATWEGATPDAIDIRALIDDEWTDWYSLEIDTAGTPGTEPFMAAGATGVQIRAAGKAAPTAFRLSLNTGEGAGGTEEDADVNEPEVAPEPASDLEPAMNADAAEASFMPVALRTDTSFVNAASRALTASPAKISGRAAVSAPAIMSRSAWGAGVTDWPVETATLSGAIIHHTAGNNNYTAAQAPGVVKGIWNYHTFGRGWGDIGYNFLVDKYGKIYEGRTGSLASLPGKMPIGAHAAPANTGSVGISVLGDYTAINPSQASLDAITSVLAWQFGRAGIDPFGQFSYRDRAGVMRSINAISGHLDVAATACPARIYGNLGDIRAKVASQIRQAGSAGTADVPDVVDVPAPIVYAYSVRSGHGWPATDVWGLGDFNEDGLSDLLLRKDGKLLFYAGRGNDQFMPGQQIGHGWDGMVELFTGIDFDGDGLGDVVALHKDRTLYLYSGTGSGGVQPGRKIGHGWSFAHMLAVEKGTGGKPSFLGIKSNGDLYIYATDGVGTFNGTSHVPGNYSHLVGTSNVGDWDGSGYSDAIGIAADGHLYYYADIAEGGYSQRTRIGSRWGGMSQLELGYSDGNLHRFYAISSTGILYTYGYRYQP